MSAQLLIFRPFQSARAAARSAGINDEAAIRQIREAQAAGREGNEIAGQMRTRAWHVRNGYAIGPQDDGSAA